MNETLAAAVAPASIDRLGPGALFAGRYAVLSLLGHGGMGAVYRVLDRELDEEVALKVLKPEIADVEGAIDRFRREVKLARRVTHPNVARTFDLGAHDGLRFLTMELIVGEPLSSRIRAGRLPLADALRVVAEIARGLAAAHAVGVVHRDLKPENVMIAAVDGGEGSRRSLTPPSAVPRLIVGERVVLTDFGIARLAEGHAVGSQTAAGTMGFAIGTPAYMAPEQLEARELDGRADVYALGIVLYELLTGVLPFSGDTVYALAAARLREDAPDPRARDATIPDPIAVLVIDAMARRREGRPDAQTFLQRLETLRGAGDERGIDRVPRLPQLDLERLTPVGPRTVALAPLDAHGAEAQGLAGDVGAAIADALATVRGVRLVPPSSMRAPGTHADLAALGRAVHADVVLGGTVRVSSGTIRAQVRLVDATSAVQAWAERFDGPLDDPFGLEDRVVAAVTSALRGRIVAAHRQAGPADPAVRALWERGRLAYSKFGPPFVEEAIVSLREARALAPDDAHVLSALGAALARKWVLANALDRDTIAEAEELSLRALAIDASIGDTFATIGILRLQHGETRAAVRAFQEAVARTPLHAEAHGYLGRLLAESGFVEEAIRRFDLALRLDPTALTTHWEKARTLALLGDRAAATAVIERGIALAGPLAGVIAQVRFVLWWNDRALARQLAATIEAAGQTANFARSLFLPMMQGYAEGKSFGELIDIFRNFADTSTTSPRQRSFFFQLATEYYAAAGMPDEALDALEKAAALPLIDLLWLDRCPVLAPFRDTPGFLRARATTAARVAEVWM